MAVYKCKMCGGSLELNNESGIATCEYCGSVQTLPKGNDDVVTNLFNRANNLRIKCEFDKAAEVYEKILNENNSDAEAHWGLVLCKYGIEYVEDPKTYKRIPTCHRTQYESILTDIDYMATLANSDGEPKTVYKAQAEEIAALQKDILAIVENEKPFDVFICYKETDENGKRTIDSALANDIYYQLTQEGLKVFYAAITLEDKLGVEYEPYIFAALNSAKVMLVVGTKPEYFDAIWVRNEWSRYLKLMKADRSKLLIPCYRDMDAYDLPEEFSHLQAQDMSKIGFVNDVVRGIKKITAEPKKEEAAKEQVVINQAGNTDALLKRAFMALEDGEFGRADDFCEQVLNYDPENAQAYLGKLMAQLNIKNMEQIAEHPAPFGGNPSYQKILRFGDEELKNTLSGYLDIINKRIEAQEEEERQKELYEKAMAKAKRATVTSVTYNTLQSIRELSKAVDLLDKISEYKDSAEKAEEYRNKIYKYAEAKMAEKSVDFYAYAAEAFGLLGDWKDSKQRKAEAEAKIKRSEEKKKALIKNSIKFGVPALAILIIFLVVLFNLILPMSNYSKAQKAEAAGEYVQAIQLYRKAKKYSDAQEKIVELWGKAYARKTVSSNYTHTLLIKNDGTVIAVGHENDDACDVSGWTDIVAVSAGFGHSVGLKADGTVVAVGDNDEGECNVDDWTNIVAISAGNGHTVGLKADGTVVAVGENSSGQCNVNTWNNIIAISAGDTHTVGITADGQTVANAYSGDDDYYKGECNVNTEGWVDIIAISAGGNHTVGLKNDGTVVATPFFEEYNYYSYGSYSDYEGQCEVYEWTDVVSVVAGDEKTLALMEDGTVVMASEYADDYEDELSEWKDIIAIFGKESTFIGLKADGTVVAIGSYSDEISGLTDIKIPTDN